MLFRSHGSATGAKVTGTGKAVGAAQVAVMAKMQAHRFDAGLIRIKHFKRNILTRCEKRTSENQFIDLLRTFLDLLPDLGAGSFVVLTTQVDCQMVKCLGFRSAAFSRRICFQDGKRQRVKRMQGIAFRIES